MSLFDLALHAIDYLGTLVIVIEVVCVVAYVAYRYMSRERDHDTSLDRLLQTLAARATKAWKHLVEMGRQRRLRH